MITLDTPLLWVRRCSQLAQQPTNRTVFAAQHHRVFFLFGTEQIVARVATGFELGNSLVDNELPSITLSTH